MSTTTLSKGFFDNFGDTRRNTSVSRDDSGAIMVIGVFMAMLVTGFLYYIVGIGNTIIYRERMQDAADAIAFSGAVVHARGMNLIAMINIVLLVLMTVYIALNLIWFATVILAVLTFGTAGPAEEFMRNLRDGYARIVLQPALTLGHSAQEIIRNTFPGIAQVRVLTSTLSGSYSPPASGGLLLPLIPYRTLPVDPVPLLNIPRGLCYRASLNITDVLTIPLNWIPILRPIRGPLSRTLAGLIGTLGCITDRPSWRNYDLRVGGGDCTDGMPGQNCEYTQLRGVAIASGTPFARNERGVAVATMGRGAGGGAFSTLAPLAQVGIAQSEYYFDGTEDRDEWCWHMYWRARLRRVRLGGLTSSIPGLGAVAGTIDRVIVH
jgi:hypothetical protein